MELFRKDGDAMTDFIHQGRAANCECRYLEGKRCPDCNHVLTGLEGDDIICLVCGKHVLSEEKIARDREINLIIQDADTVTGADLSSN